ncbi:MAG TPA: hypothetical protein VN026_12490 [Bacteroidia bacterium]|jgi:uncharacterized protein (DUF305 family)|nr:hypothetical protein [Bacteroidia bacterium]
MEKKMLENLSLRTKLKQLAFGGLLLIAPVLSQDLKAQTEIVTFKTGAVGHEDLMRPMNSMMDKIFSIKMSGDFDKDYVSIMEEFQQGGINLCKIYEMSGEDAKLLENAKVSVVELKEDQKQLKTFYNKDVTASTAKTGHNELMQTLNSMMKQMKDKGQSGDLNKDYAVVMSLYNWANSEMAKVELNCGQNSELKNRCSAIVDEFSCHENTLNEWLDKSFAEK